VNGFSLCAGLYLSNESTANTLAVLDGDVYGSKADRRARIKKVITGDQPIHHTQRAELMRLVRTLSPTKNSAGQLLSPEQVLHRMLHGLDIAVVPVDRTELHRIALEIINVPERHAFVNRIIEHSGESRETALSKIVELASLSSDWKHYTRVVRTWFLRQKDELGL
jgi:hypothetical protein